MKFFMYFLALLLLAHFPLLIVTQIENPDAGIMYLILDKLNSPALYLKALINFQTLDFQPVRDLTLYLEKFIYDETGYVIAVFLNIVVFAGCAYQVFRIIQDDGSKMSRTTALLFTGCFAVYPIFLQSVNWGAARKHLLALLFILYASRLLIAWEKTKGRNLSIVLSYLLSVLSLPMAIAWPFWALLRLGIRRSLRDSDARKLFIILFTIMLLMVGLNFAYYKTSYVFLEFYPQKARVFDLLLALTNLGLQFNQLVYPYELSFYYNNDDSIFVGYIALVVLLAIVLWKTYQDRRAYVWPCFGLLSLVITLSTPDIYYDPYINFIVTGFAVFAGIYFGDLIQKYRYVLVIPLLFWTGFTISKSSLWVNSISYYGESYRHNPNCTSAVLLGRKMYQKALKLPDELYNYIQLNECLKGEDRDSPMMRLQKLTFETTSLFFEDEIDDDYRYQRLEELGKKHYLPLSVLAALYAKNNQPEKFEEAIGLVLDRLGPNRFNFGYDFIVSENVIPYCLKTKVAGCDEFVKIWAHKPKHEPFF